MSITRQFTVWCDLCGQWDQASMTATKLRLALKKRGWTRVGNSDFCKECSKKRAEVSNATEMEP